MRTEDHLDRMLDEALEMTFPASDPFTVYMPDRHNSEERSDIAWKARSFQMAA